LIKYAETVDSQYHTNHHESELHKLKQYNKTNLTLNNPIISINNKGKTFNSKRVSEYYGKMFKTIVCNKENDTK
jgi:hypothetical protein